MGDSNSSDDLAALCAVVTAELDPATAQTYAAGVSSSSSPGLCALGTPILATLNRQPNSPRFLARLAREFIEGLSTIPLVPAKGYAPRYAAIISALRAAEAGAGITPQALLLAMGLLGKNAYLGYDPVLAPGPRAAPHLSFPPDHGLHFGIQTEWYFLVGTGKAANGIRYGIEIMIYMYDVFPAPFLVARGLDPRDFRFYAVHFGVTLAPASGAATYHRAAVPPVFSGASGLVAFDGGDGVTPFSLRIGADAVSCAIVSSSPTDLFPMTAQCSGFDAAGAPMSVALQLAATKPLFLQGDRGCLPCISGTGSIYYSYSSVVTTAGSVMTSEGTLDITGANPDHWWLDHQWMSGMTGPGFQQSLFLRSLENLLPAGLFAGWDWFQWSEKTAVDSSGQVSGNIEYTLAAPRTSEYETVPTGEVHESAIGKMIAPDGTAYPATADLYLSGWIVTDGAGAPMVPVVHGAALAPGSVVWPTLWRFVITSPVARPTSRFLLVLNPLTVGRFATLIPYKETPVIVTDGATGLGVGFAESVGYQRPADIVSNALAVLNIPQSNAPLFVSEPKPTPLLAGASAAYVTAVALLVLLILIGLVLAAKRAIRHVTSRSHRAEGGAIGSPPPATELPF